MAVIWSSPDVKFADMDVLASGIVVSVSVWKGEQGTYPIKFKRQRADGTWPPDSEAVTITAFSGQGAKARPVYIRERRGVLTIGDGFNFMMECRTDGQNPADWRSI